MTNKLFIEFLILNNYLVAVYLMSALYFVTIEKTILPFSNVSFPWKFIFCFSFQDRKLNLERIKNMATIVKFFRDAMSLLVKLYD